MLAIDREGCQETSQGDHRDNDNNGHMDTKQREEGSTSNVSSSSSASSSPSIPDENINFDLVYALHTFSATVEGQVSVAKGDALILMEDSNTYWWLVEVLKTSEIGYIPAENIETPYERLARLNKHRNVDMASQIIYDASFTPSPLRPIRSAKRKTVTIGDESTMVIHYPSDSESDEEEEGEHGEEGEEHNVSQKLEVKEEQTTSDLIDDDCTRIYHDPDVAEADVGDQESYTSIDREDEQPEGTELVMETKNEPTTMSLRVFAGSLGSAAPTHLFHTICVTKATTAEELTLESVSCFGLDGHHGRPEGDEYYLTVQGMDGDEYVLSPQDKPMAIFQTLTAPLTTPMPAPSSATVASRRTAPHSCRPIRSSSSSFSMVQTDHDEDSVLRFYLHRRLRRAHERDSAMYIKVSFYPDDHAITLAEQSGSMRRWPFGNREWQDMDRVDKIIAISPTSCVRDVIDMALTKFHITDAVAEGCAVSQAGGSTTAAIPVAYRLSVRDHGKVVGLSSLENMATVFSRFNASTMLEHGQVTSDLSFMLSKAPSERPEKRDPPPSLTGSLRGLLLRDDGTGSTRSSRARPSVLNLVSPAPSDTLQPLEPPAPPFRQIRSSSLGPYGTDQQSTAWESASRQGDQGQPGLLHPMSAAASGPLSFFRRTSAPSPSPSTTNVSELQHSQQRTKKENSFKQQLKRLVGWGSKSKKLPSSSLITPVPLAMPTRPPPTSPSWSSPYSWSACPSPDSDSLVPPTMQVQRSMSSTSLPPVSMPLSPISPGSPASPARHPFHVTAIAHKDERMSSSTPEPLSAQDSAEQPPVESPRPVSMLSSDSSDTSSLSSSLSLEEGDDLSSLSDNEDDNLSKQNDTFAETRPAAGGQTSVDAPYLRPESSDLNDIRAQYARWMDSQPSLEPVPELTFTVKPITDVASSSSTNTDTNVRVNAAVAAAAAATTASPLVSATADSEPTAADTVVNSPIHYPNVSDLPLSASSTASTSTQASTTVHGESEKSAVLVEDTTAVSGTQQPMHPMTVSAAGGEDIGDLFLLVTHGVDFLEQCERTQWKEDDGRYEFHPWNRPKGPFSVPPSPNTTKKTTTIATSTTTTTLENEEEEKQDHQQRALALLSSGRLSEPAPPSSPPATQTEYEPSHGCDRIPLSPPMTPSTRKDIQGSALSPPIKKETNLDDEELQRIVATHIVF